MQIIHRKNLISIFNGNIQVYKYLQQAELGKLGKFYILICKIDKYIV